MREAGEVARQAAHLDREPQARAAGAASTTLEARAGAAAQRAQAQRAQRARQILDGARGRAGVLVGVREQHAGRGSPRVSVPCARGEVVGQRLAPSRPAGARFRPSGSGGSTNAATTSVTTEPTPVSQMRSTA